MKPLILPASKRKPAPKPSGDSRRLVVIGANGAGKTRFTDAMCADPDNKAFRLNAIDALYAVRSLDAEHNAIDALVADSIVPVAEQERPQCRLERLLSLLMGDELVSLLDYKIARHAGKTASLPPSTRLDTVFELWKAIFPGSNMFVSGGRIRFSRRDSNDTYKAFRLSDGERVVLYYASAVLYAPKDANIVIDSPEMFLHPTTMQSLWNRIEELRPDCRMVYVTHDLDFASSRLDAEVLWVRSYDAGQKCWDYDIMPRGAVTPDIYAAIVGERKPVLFVEGDVIHSIDYRLYSLIFREYAVKPLGSCDRVIEATRTFNTLSDFHHLTAMGIVDRDRRDDREIEYLRSRNINVPAVAEIENMFLLPEVVAAAAEACGKNAGAIVQKVRAYILGEFKHMANAQALEHTRHRVKRLVEYRIDGKFNNINALQQHLASLPEELNPRAIYESLCREFRGYISQGDYLSVLRVFNHKPMLADCGVATLCGLANKDRYIRLVLRLLRGDDMSARRIRMAVLRALDVKDTTPRSVTAQTAASRGAMSRNIDGTVAQVENKDKK